MADTPINVQTTFPSQPQQMVEYIGGPLNGQRLPVANAPTPPNPNTGKCYMWGTGIVVPCDWPGATTNPLPFTTTLPNGDANPSSTAQGSNPNSGTLSGPLSSLPSVNDFIGKLENKNTWKGIGLLGLAVGVGLLGIIIFVFAPSPQTTAKTALRAAV